MSRSSTIMILEESWRFGNLEDNATTFKLVGVNRAGLWAWPRS